MTDDLDIGANGWEGWDTRDTDDEHVRRFAKPPFRWVTVSCDRFGDRRKQ